MGRHKIYFKYDDPITVVRIVEAIISDFPRKERVIAYSSAAPELLSRYIAVNTVINNAVTKFEPQLCRIIVHDIIDRVGYEKSDAAMYTSRGAYYRRRKMLIHDIAVELMLI